MTTSTENTQPKTLTELGARAGALYVNLKQLERKLSALEESKDPSVITTNNTYAAAMTENARNLLTHADLDEAMDCLEEVPGRPGRYVLVGDHSRSGSEDLPLEHMGTALFQVAASLLTHIEQMVHDAEQRFNTPDENAEFSGIIAPTE